MSPELEPKIEEERYSERAKTRLAGERGREGAGGGGGGGREERARERGEERGPQFPNPNPRRPPRDIDWLWGMDLRAGLAMGMLRTMGTAGSGPQTQSHTQLARPGQPQAEAKINVH